MPMRRKQSPALKILLRSVKSSILQAKTRLRDDFGSHRAFGEPVGCYFSIVVEDRYPFAMDARTPALTPPANPSSGFHTAEWLREPIFGNPKD